MNISQYWTQPPAKRNRQLTTINKREKQFALEQEAEEKQMLIHDGKLVAPEDYPCVCEMACPSQCYEERENIEKRWTRKEKQAEQCFCPCHTYYEPF